MWRRVATPDDLAVHFHGAGALAKAADYALAAGDKAAETLAFMRAAELYRKAREWDARDETWRRRLFTREYLMQSEWYAERLRTKQSRDVALWTRHLHALQRFQAAGDTLGRGGVEQRLAGAREHMARVSADGYLKELEGGLGADPFGSVP